MEISILEERPNPLLHRKEYRFQVTHGTEPTPSRDSVRTEFAKAVHVPKDRVVIERMNAKFGMARTEGFAASYDSAEVLKSVVRDHIQIRNGIKEKPVKGPVAPAEAPAPSPPPPEKPAVEKPKEKVPEKPAKTSEEKPAEKHAGKSAEKPGEKPAEKPKEKHAEKPAEKKGEKATEKPGEKPARKSGEKTHDAATAPKGS